MLQGFSERARRAGLVGWCGLMIVLGAGALPSAAQSGAGQSGAGQQEFARAQAAAQRILSTAEFQRPAPTWWDRVKEKIVEAIVALFTGIDRVTSQSPWMARALEWLLFAAAATALLVWVLRVMRRQRMRVELGGEAAKAAEWAKEREDWRLLAEKQAANGAWRDAIHALYWAAIVHLEHRRLWRPNASRTPREYVRLLKAGSAEQDELRALTSALERSWYGHREATLEDFSAARQSFERIANRTAPAGAER